MPDALQGHPLLGVHPGLLPFLQLTADSVAGLLGFRQCVISLRDGDEIVTVATAGVHPAYDGVQLRTLELGHRESFAVAQLLLAESAAGGGFAEVNHSHFDPEQLVLATPPASGEHVHHTIFEPLSSEGGEPVGMLTAITPGGAESPTAAQIELVRRHALQAATAIRVSLGLRDDQRQIRVADTSRSVVRSLATADDLAAEWPAVLTQIARAYEADDVILHQIAPDSSGRITTTRVPVQQVPLALDFLTATARAAWRTRRARVVNAADIESDQTPKQLRPIIAGWFERTHVGSAIFVPIGAGDTCLGAVVISRRVGAHTWTTTELNGATALGADLGLVLYNRRTLEQQQKYVVELQTIDAYQDQLVDTVTGMLRAPLERIQSRLEALEPAPATEATGEIEQDVQEMNQLIDDLLFFSRVTDPRRSQESELINVAALARRAVDLISPMADRDGLALAVRLPGPDPLVTGDEAELNRMVMNVVSNAVRFTERGSVTVSVARGATEAEITVRDTGTGIPVDEQPQVFDDFFRGANAVALPGSGLGLAIAARIAARHGGRIMLASEPGVGTTVRLYLPLAPD